MVGLVNPAGPPVMGVFRVAYPDPRKETPSGIEQAKGPFVPFIPPSQAVITNTRQFREGPAHPWKGQIVDMYA